jgi:outer membrane biosynthesis protein TonB
MNFRFVSASAVLFVMLLATGCARAKARALPVGPPPLDMPAPPPRDIETNDPEPLQPVLLPQEPARNAPPRTRPAAPPPRAEPPRQEAPKPEPATENEQPRPSEEPPRPATLQTTPAEAEVDVERNIRETLNRASSSLGRIDYRILDTNARMQYDTAKSFIRQAEAAVRAKNLVFAKSLADKAATLAVQLGGR